MATDIPSSAVSDAAPEVTTSTDDVKAGALSKLQEAAGLTDQYYINPLQKLGLLGDKNISPERHRDIGVVGTAVGFNPVPSDQNRKDAEKALESRMSKLIPEADRAVMMAMTTALMNGDDRAFADAVKKAGGDPKKLKEMVDEIDKMLEDKHCSTRLDVTGDGKVLLSDTNRNTALSFDPATGKIQARAVEQNADGSILVKPGELVHTDSDAAFKNMSNRAVNGVNGSDIINTLPWWRNVEKEPQPIYPMPGDPGWYPKHIDPGWNPRPVVPGWYPEHPEWFQEPEPHIYKDPSDPFNLKQPLYKAL